MEKLLLDGKWELHYAPEHAGKTTAQAVKEDPAYTHIEANVPGNAELDLYAAGKAPEPFWGTNLAFRPMSLRVVVHAHVLRAGTG
ncbi:MAG: hypothetical protein ACLSBB_15010 [Ruthenibacterium lactatiformans]